MAAVSANGSDKLRSVARKRERESREGSEVQGEEGKREGALGVSVAHPEESGRRGGSRSWRARGDHAPCLLA